MPTAMLLPRLIPIPSGVIAPDEAIKIAGGLNRDLHLVLFAVGILPVPSYSPRQTRAAGARG